MCIDNMTRNKKERIRKLEEQYEETIGFWNIEIRDHEEDGWIVGDTVVDIPCGTIEDIKEELIRSRDLMEEEE